MYTLAIIRTFEEPEKLENPELPEKPFIQKKSSQLLISLFL